MTDKSASVELLELARRTLRNELLEHVPSEKKYLSLMVANAMAIVARQIERGKQHQDDEEMGHLSRHIRAGKIAPGSPEYDKVYKSLCEQARQNVQVSNPGYLDK